MRKLPKHGQKPGPLRSLRKALSTLRKATAVSTKNTTVHEGRDGMTTTAAENLAGREKEKVEKRRALGRGLESLLPGPRVVQAGVPASSAIPGQDAGAAGKQRVPPVRSAPGRNDNPLDSPRGEAFAGIIQAVAQEALDEAARVGVAAVPPFPAPAQESEGITIFAQAESRMPGNLVINLAIADIDKNPFQTRYVQDDDKLEELADSIKANGVVQPIMVRPSEEDDGRYVLILGERRLHASKKAGKDTIPAMVRRVSLQQAAEMTIIENLQREDLSALEQAEAFRVLSNEFKLTQQQIGERVGLSRASVTNYMRLLKLPREVMQLLAEKKLSFSEARELLTLETDDQISQAALYAVKKGLTIEQIERLVLSMKGELDP